MVSAHYPVDREFNSRFSFQPFSSIHLYSENIEGNELNNNTTGIKPFYLYMFGVVGILLLFIACLNYTNLATAAALRRTREIGLRKSLGARQGQVVTQFITDALLVTGLSFLLCLLLLNSSLPLIRGFVQKDLLLSKLPLPWYLMLTGVVLLTAVVSAIYPAMINLRVSTVLALKGEIKSVTKKISVRKMLLMAQFTVSIAMIASTLVIYNQLKFMREKDLGINVESLLVVDINSSNLRRNFENVKAEFAKPAEVVSISASTRVPGEWKRFPVATVRQAGDSKVSEMIFVGIDQDFLTTYGISLVEGRNFQQGPADSLKVILTESGVRQLGLTNPVGQVIEIPTIRQGAGDEQLDQVFRGEVIGVAKDFHFESLKKGLMPVIFAAPNTTIQRIDYYTLKIRTTDWNGTIDKLKEINLRMDSNNPLEYTFLDNRFREFYEADAKRGQIFLTLSLIIVLITCMGLLALVSYSLESRTKEIGVRKILGATARSIVGLITVEYLALVVVAALVGLPAAWFFMDRWLQDFAYRVPLGAGIFAGAAALTLLIALATIGFRTLRAANQDIVKSLRSE